MAEYDGEIRIKATIDTDEFDKKASNLTKKLYSQNNALKRQQYILSELNQKYSDIVNKAVKTAEETSLEKSLKRAEKELSLFQRQYENAIKNAEPLRLVKRSYENLGLEPHPDYKANIEKAESDVLKFKGQIESTNSEIKRLQKELEKVRLNPENTRSAKDLEYKISLAQEKAGNLRDRIHETSQALNNIRSDKVSKMSESFSRLSDTLKSKFQVISSLFGRTFSAAISSVSSPLRSLIRGFERLGRRILRLSGLVLVFNSVRSSLRGLRDYLGGVLQTNDVFVKSLGQIKSNLMTAFYPVYQYILPALNALMGTLVKASAYLAQFMSMIFGKSISESQKGAKSLNDQTLAIKNQKKSYDSLGASVKNQKKSYDELGKSIKKAKGELAIFDKLIVLHQDKQKKPKTSTDSGFVFSPTTSFDNNFNTISNIFDVFREKIRAISETLRKGFDVGFIDKNLNQILDNIKRIGEATKKIFDDPKVTSGFNKALESVIYNLGVTVGSISSVGITIGRLLTGSIARFLEQNKETIQNQLIRCFDITSRLTDLSGNFSKAFANIFEIFASDQAQNSVANMLSGWESLFGNFAISVYDISGTILKNLLNPFISFQDDIKRNLDESLKSVEKFTESTKKLFTDISDNMTGITQESINPYIEKLGKVWNDVFLDIVEGYNKYINPMLDKMAKKWQETVDNHITPALDRVSKVFNDTIGKILPLIEKTWNFLKPFVSWLIDNAFDTLTTEIENLFDTAMNVFGNIFDFIANFRSIIGNFVSLVASLLSGDWNSAWESAGKVVESMVNTAKSAINVLGSIVNGMINKLIGGINVAIRSINLINFDLPDWMGGGHFGLNIPEVPKNFGNIPMLAQGAVLRGGNPMIAYLNDQPRGQVNIEAPLKTMIDAFDESLRKNGNNQGNVTIEATGDIGKLVSFLNFKLKQENQRIGNNLVTGDVFI